MIHCFVFVQSVLLFVVSTLTAAGETALSVAALKADVEMVETLLRHGGESDFEKKAIANHENKHGQTVLTVGGYHLLTIVHVFKPHLSCFNLFTTTKRNSCEHGLSLSPTLCATRGVNEPIPAVIRGGGNPDYETAGGYSALMHATLANHLSTIFTLIEAGAQVDHESSRRRTALGMACAQGASTDSINKLVGLGANVSHINGDGMSILMLAAEAQSIEAIRLVIKAGADTGFRADKRAGDAAGHTALSWASARMKLESVKAITNASQGGDVDGELAMDGKHKSALAKAATDGDVQTIAALVEVGADPNKEGADSQTPLIHAAIAGQPAAIAALCECGARVDFETSGNRTALVLAAMYGKLDSIAALITCGAAVDQITKDGKTALMFAVEVGRTDAIAALVRRGAELDKEVEGGVTPLIYAARVQEVDSIAALVQRGATVDFETGGGATALIEAAQLGKTQSCRALVTEGHARTDRESRTGLTALIAAARANNAEGCKAMIDLHADFNYENRNGDTAVFVASHGGALDALSALLAGGAAANHENNFGFTPLTSLLKVDASDFNLAAVVGMCTS